MVVDYRQQDFEKEMGEKKEEKRWYNYFYKYYNILVWTLLRKNTSKYAKKWVDRNEPEIWTQG